MDLSNGSPDRKPTLKKISLRTRLTVSTCFVLLATLIFGEIVARLVLGLGNPPLSTEHKTIEYLFKPNQDVERFGNRFKVNQFGMRSDDVPFPKDEEFRVICFGDSVLNGGVLTDQKYLATTLLEKKLKEVTSDAYVGNISAGSWGPGNWRAYADEYGFFDANIVILVISSHDYRDIPDLHALGYEHAPNAKTLFCFS